MSRVSKELQLAALAALVLALSMFLPWYQKSLVVGRDLAQGNVNALGAFTFVEAAILLDCVAVLFLVWARSRQKGFHLPGGDGTAISLAGGWAVLLILYRALDQPDDMGIQWGMFVAFAAAGALVAAGLRVRAMHAPEPPNPAADDIDWVAPPQRTRERTPDRRPRDATAVTEMLRDRPTWEEQTTRLDDEPTTRLPDPSEDRTTRLPDPSEERTARLFDDPSRAETTRLPDEAPEARTRRRRRPDEHPPLFDDDPPR